MSSPSWRGGGSSKPSGRRRRPPGRPGEGAPAARQNDEARQTGDVAERLVSPVFVGRQRELDAIDGRWQRAVAGDPAVVLVGGEGGVGKTRVVEEICHRATEGGARVLIGRCVP